MSLLQYALYKYSPQISNPNPIGHNPNAFSVNWTGTPNAMGINPPNPQFQRYNQPPYVHVETSLPAPSLKGTYPDGILQSRREPFGVEYLYNPYGGLESRLGTNLGA